MKHVPILMLLICLGLTSGCNQEKKLNRGFSLPQGDAVLGQAVFVEKHCIECHTMASTEFVGPEWEVNQTHAINVTIGGEVTKLKTYGDLVTSIINPSHRIAKGYVFDEVTDDDGKSKMRNYNDAMTVSELINLVAFLHPQYELMTPPVTSYPHYIYPN